MPSLEDLESHFTSTLDKYPAVMSCYNATAKKLAQRPVTESVMPSVLSSNSNRVPCVAVPIVFGFVLVVLCIRYQALRLSRSKEKRYFSVSIEKGPNTLRAVLTMANTFKNLVLYADVHMSFTSCRSR